MHTPWYKDIKTSYQFQENLRVSSQELAEQQQVNLQSSNAEFQITFWQDSLKLLLIALSSWGKRYHEIAIIVITFFK